MFPNIAYLIEYITGYFPTYLTFIQTFGFFFALAFVTAAWVLGKELDRKQRQGLLDFPTIEEEVGKPFATSKYIWEGIIGFIFGFKFVEIILNFDSFILDPQSTILSAQGNIFGGILIAAVMVYFKYRENQKQLLDKPVIKKQKMTGAELSGQLTFIAAIFGVLGAKIFHFLEYPDQFIDFLNNPSAGFFSGLTYYGGLIVATVAVIYYCRKHKIPLLHLMDAIAPILILAYGVGRIGCHMSGDGDWGIANTLAKPSWFFLPDWAWSLTYQHNVINEGVLMTDCVGNYCYELPQPVWPTALYEAAMGIGIFGILWAIRRKFTIPGMLFAIYMVFNGLERFSIEKIRVNAELDVMGGITQAEIISSIIILMGIIGIAILYTKRDEIRSKFGLANQEER